MTRLTQHAEGLWTADQELTLAGFPFGTRMTVIKYDKGLILYSPIKISPELKEEVSKLGDVKILLAPNFFHHMFVSGWQEAFPQAQLWASSSLKKKTRHLRVDRFLSEGESLSSDLEMILVEGHKVKEFVIWHPNSSTLVATDLVLNFERPQKLWPNLFMKMAGLKVGVSDSRLLRFLTEDRQVFVNSIKKLCAFKFQRLIICHGKVIEKDAWKVVESTYPG